MEATPTEHSLPLRFADFPTLSEALDYAAEGETGYNFYNGRGKLDFVLPYASLRARAVSIARRLMGLNLERGARVALVADTYPGFLQFFFACQYAGFVPVPLPASIYLGGHKAYVDQLKRLLAGCRADVAIAPEGFLSFLVEAVAGDSLRFVGSPEAFENLLESEKELHPSEPGELAYLQFTSGSTRFPRGVMITQQTVMDNLANIAVHGVKAQKGDRCMSWLPYFHDMGLVGLVLAPMASQTSVDYLSTRTFGMRPRLWLTLMSQNRSTISFGPPFGYELCLQRLREDDIAKFDLSAWRLAGVGAETIRPEPLAEFAEMLAPSGFQASAFVACYGMAECSLAVSFANLDKGIDIDWVNGEHLSKSHLATPAAPRTPSDDGSVKALVNCGSALPGYEVDIRDVDGKSLPERHCGTLYVKGPSVMSGYFGERELTREVLSEDGWLNTGDLAYRVGDHIIITGREKDLIIINGRNVWPQDLEYLAESQPEVRTGDASAFSVSDQNGQDAAVLVIECRESDTGKRSDLVRRVQGLIRSEHGIECYIELVPRNTLPRTTSGKLSRSGAKNDYLKRVADGYTLLPGSGGEISVLQKEAV